MGRPAGLARRPPPTTSPATPLHAAGGVRGPLQDGLALALQDGNCFQEEDLGREHAHRLHFDCITQQCKSEDTSKRMQRAAATYI